MKLPNPLVGMAGVFYVCYELSRRGWYCFPTIRNTAGVDIVAYSIDWTKVITIQVKSLTKRSAVPMKRIDIPFNYLVIVRKVLNDRPEVFILSKEETRLIAKETRNKRGEIQYWFEYKDYEAYNNRWDIIGSGY